MGLRYFCACMRVKPQFRQHFILTLLDIRAHVSARSVSDSFFFFFFLVFLSCHFSQPGLVGFGFLSRACARNHSFGNILFSRFFTFVPMVLREASRTVFFALFILSFCRSQNPCPKHNNVRVPRAINHQSIHAQTVKTFVFQEQSITRASMPHHNNVRVPSAYAYQRIHAQTIITFVFRVHTLTRESMPKP